MSLGTGGLYAQVKLTALDSIYLAGPRMQCHLQVGMQRGLSEWYRDGATKLDSHVAMTDMNMSRASLRH